MMKSQFAFFVSLLLAGAGGMPASAGGLAVQRVAQDSVAATSPYLPGSPVWNSPYVSGPVLGGVFYDGPSDEAIGVRGFSPVPGVSCSLRRHACWRASGIDRAWTARFFGLKS